MLDQVIFLNEIKPNDVLLLLDNDGKVRGMDQIINIDLNGNVNYKSYGSLYIKENYQKVHIPPIFQGNANKWLDNYQVYKMPLFYVEKYNDMAFHHALISWDYGEVYTDVLNQNNPIAKMAWSSMIKLATLDFKFRMKFIDFTNDNKEIIGKLYFIDTSHEINNTQREQLNLDMYNVFFK